MVFYAESQKSLIDKLSEARDLVSGRKNPNEEIDMTRADIADLLSGRKSPLDL